VNLECRSLAAFGTTRRARLGAALVAALFPVLAAAGTCLQFASHPDGAPLAEVAVNGGAFAVTYVHSVTRTPVVERYRIEGRTIVEFEMKFAQHGPGLPTEPDAGHAFEQRDGQLIVSMERRLPTVVMRVNRDQSPRLTSGEREVDLAAWGNRAVVVRAAPCATQ
jgi:hypothetical protein